MQHMKQNLICKPQSLILAQCQRENDVYYELQKYFTNFQETRVKQSDK